MADALGPGRVRPDRPDRAGDEGQDERREVTVRRSGPPIACDAVTGELRTRAFVILGLSGLAVTQPLLDLFGSNPEFFVAGNYSRGQIVWFARAHRRRAAARRHRRHGPGHARSTVASARVVFGVVAAALATAFALGLLRTLGVDARGRRRRARRAARRRRWRCSSCDRRGMQLFVSYLAVANLFFVGSFLFLSPTSELIAGGRAADVGEVVVPPLDGPVVLIVLDELPAATMMRADGIAERGAVPGLRRAGGGEHVVPQRVQPVQPDPPGRPVDPRRAAGRRRRPARRPPTIRATCSRCSVMTSRCTATSR